MSSLRVADFDFALPPELIAQQPPAERGQSRMLLMSRATGALRDSTFAELPALLNPGDLLVLNESRVIPARLYAYRAKNLGAPGPDLRTWESTNPNPSATQSSKAGRPTLAPPFGARVGDHEPQQAYLHPPTGKIEVFLTEPAGENLWRALVKPGRKVPVGESLVFCSPTGEVALEADVLERGPFGERLLRFLPVDDFFAALDRIGHIPLPPYIRRPNSYFDAATDRERYQTVFSREPGSVAAPTAGLHFTSQILEALSARGVETARITLHVGLGTFAPLRVDRLDQVRLHRERYTLTAAAAEAINRANAEARRIVAVGTTVVRTLEHCALQAKGYPLQEHSGETEIFISPSFEFRLVGALLTNFHLPQSSLLMLVSAFAGREQVLAAYRHAVQQHYRFFSYGDCIFLA